MYHTKYYCICKSIPFGLLYCVYIANRFIQRHWHLGRRRRLRQRPSRASRRHRLLGGRQRRRSRRRRGTRPVHPTGRAGRGQVVEWKRPHTYIYIYYTCAWTLNQIQTFVAGVPWGSFCGSMRVANGVPWRSFCIFQ